MFPTFQVYVRGSFVPVAALSVESPQALLKDPNTLCPLNPLYPCIELHAHKVLGG